MADMTDGQAQSSETVLEFEGLEKEFQLGLRLRRVHAVCGVTLQVKAGEIFGYLGPNGAGKTTTMKMAMGLIKPTAGTIRVFGRSVDDTDARRRVGYLPEHPYFYDYLTAREILDFYGRLYEIPKDARRRRIDELLELVGLTYAADRTLRRFSKGMLQRVGVAQALINDPDLVVLDEPLSGLDPMGRKEVRDIIAGLRAQGKTVFFSSHILHDIETICDRVAILVEGRVVQLAPLAELLDRGSAQVEITADGLDATVRAALEALGGVVTDVGRSAQVLIDELKQSEALQALMAGGVRVTHVTPYRRSLEELFVEETATRGARNAS